MFKKLIPLACLMLITACAQPGPSCCCKGGQCPMTKGEACVCECCKDGQCPIDKNGKPLKEGCCCSKEMKSGKK